MNGFETDAVLTILADGWGLSVESIEAAMEAEESIRERIERLRDGELPEAELTRLNADIKLRQMGEPMSPTDA